MPFCRIVVRLIELDFLFGSYTHSYDSSRDSNKFLKYPRHSTGNPSITNFSNQTILYFQRSKIKWQAVVARLVVDVAASSRSTLVEVC